MDRLDRARLARFESIMSRLDAAERDTLLRLRREGFGFRSLDAARAQLVALRRDAVESAARVARLAEFQSRKG